MTTLHELEERILRLEKQNRELKRARKGLIVEPALNILGQNTRIDGNLYLGGNAVGVWQDWTPTGSASGSMTWTSITWTYARYMRIGQLVIASVYGIGTIGGTASTDLRCTLPVTPKAGQTQAASAMPIVLTPEAMVAYIGAGTGLLTVRRYNSANWPLGSYGFTATVLYMAN